jgi:hypothetical protein
LDPVDHADRHSNCKRRNGRLSGVIGTSLAGGSAGSQVAPRGADPALGALRLSAKPKRGVLATDAGRDIGVPSFVVQLQLQPREPVVETVAPVTPEDTALEPGFGSWARPSGP